MRLSFYWLKAISPLEQGPSMLLPETITDDYIIEPPILPDHLDSGGRYHHENLSKAILMLFDCEGCNVVSSGNDIIITTPDPDHLPLPDEELLWMQLTLHRLTALCAAAGFQADFSYEDDDFAAGACIMTPPGVHEEVREEVVKNLAYPSSYRKCSSKPFPRNLMFLDTSSGWNAAGRVLFFSSLTISLCMKRESWTLGWYRRYTIL